VNFEFRMKNWEAAARTGGFFFFCHSSFEIRNSLLLTLGASGASCSAKGHDCFSQFESGGMAAAVHIL